MPFGAMLRAMLVSLLLGCSNGDPAPAQPAAPITPISPDTPTEWCTGSITINLRDSAGGRLLELEPCFPVTSAEAEVLEAQRAAILHDIIMMGTDYSYEFLETTEGRIALKEDVQDIINNALEKPSHGSPKP
jgi:flagellar basal body-associated protein FliL